MALDRPELLDAAVALRDGPAGLAPRRWTPASGQPRRGRRRQRRDPRGLRGTGDGPGDAVPAHRRSALADGGRRLIDTALAHFADPDRPGRWFDTADDAEALMVRPADPARRRDTGGCLTDRRGDHHRRPPRRRRPRREVPRGRGGHADRAHAAVGAGPALGRALAGSRRSDGARSATDRGGLRCRRLTAVDGGTPAGTRRRRRRRRCAGLLGVARRAATGSTAPTRPMCATGRCAICRSPVPGTSPPRWESAV